jgi:hypothetical protein
MKTKTFRKTIVALTAVILAAGFSFLAISGSVSAKGPSGRGNSGEQYGGASSCTSSGDCISTNLETLSAEEEDGLILAIQEEYKALNLYKAVINEFGNIAPFAQIVKSEQQHVNSLVKQADKYGVVVPSDPGVDASITFDSVSSACEAGVSAEIEDAALYDELTSFTNNTALLRVYSSLQSASLNSHLPAFQACE